MSLYDNPYQKELLFQICPEYLKKYLKLLFSIFETCKLSDLHTFTIIVCFYLSRQQYDISYKVSAVYSIMLKINEKHRSIAELSQIIKWLSPIIINDLYLWKIINVNCIDLIKIIFGDIGIYQIFGNKWKTEQNFIDHWANHIDQFKKKILPLEICTKISDNFKRLSLIKAPNGITLLTQSSQYYKLNDGVYVSHYTSSFTSANQCSKNIVKKYLNNKFEKTDKKRDYCLGFKRILLNPLNKYNQMIDEKTDEEFDKSDDLVISSDSSSDSSSDYKPVKNSKKRKRFSLFKKIPKKKKINN
jgi:hypothetical protein